MVESMLWSVGIPVTAGGLLLAVCWWVLGFGRWPWMTRIVVVLAIGGAAGGSFLASVGLPGWPPAQKWHGVFLMAGAATAAGLIEAMCPRRDWAGRVVLAMAIGVASVWLLPLPEQSALTVGWVAGGSALLVGMLDRARGGLAVPVGGWAAAAAISVMAIVAGSMTLSLMAGAVSAMCGLVIVLGWFAGGRVTEGVSGGGLTLGGILAVIALTAWAYDYNVVPGWAWAVSGSGFALACILEIGPLGRWKGYPATVVRSIVMISPPVYVVVHEWDAVKGALSG